MTTSAFPLKPLHRFAGQNSAVRQPQEITCFSYDSSHKLRLDSSSLRYYYTPELNVPLSEGFETFIKHDDSVDEHLDSLLEALIDLERRTGRKCSADIVTWRGMMTKFMSLPFNMRDGFEMLATKFQDTIFIEEHHAYRQRTQGPTNKRGEIMSFWGYKFETLSTLPSPWDDCPRSLIESRTSEVVSNEAQFCSIVKTGFGPVRLILGGEVDAAWDARLPPPLHPSLDDPNPQPPTTIQHNYVELKTSKEIMNQRDDVAFERKLQKFWAQSFLLGVGRVLVGFRDDDGILRSVREFDTQSIPTIAKRSGRNLWDGKLSIDFTTSVLKWILETVVDDGVWLIRHRENGQVLEVERTDRSTFLSESFVKWRTGNSFS
ncbi:rai1 protein [Sphaerosporella brunnea]|uniref:Decapping nuclease n=1 Tax=Sphaerosporella brunnea TaxID=1250544 RepID=A0A5J5F3Z5_9PEZI|nr:rai1 protein [Sphaerosporella brunnea]